MARGTEWTLRLAGPADVSRICAFGEVHVRPHYAPLIGAEAADAQVRDWWSPTRIGAAVSTGLIVVAESGDRVVGVAQRGRHGADHVIYKLYVDPGFRSHGLGPRLIDALIGQLPPDASRVGVEHFAGNVRAGAFYEREGLTVDRVEPSVAGDPALDVVWRTRPLTGSERT